MVIMQIEFYGEINNYIIVIYMNESEQVFWLAVITSAVGITTLIIKSLSRSKCDEIKCGCIKIHRNVDLEEKLDELELNNKKDSEKL